MSETLKAVVQLLTIYPVKACAGVRVTRLDCHDEGLIAGDREWVVVNMAVEVVWQGLHPRLTLVVPSFSPGLLHLSGPGGAQIDVSIRLAGAPCQIKIWNDVSKANGVFAPRDPAPAGGSRAELEFLI